LAEKEADSALKTWITRSAKIQTAKAEFKQLRYLKTVRKPLESAGTVYFSAPGSIRWSSGDKMIATIQPGKPLTIQHVEKKEAEVYTREMLEQKSGGQGLTLLESGFPRSLEGFQKQFKVLSTEKLDGGYVKFECELAGKTNPIIRKLVFFIKEQDGILGALHFYLRDGSRIENSFTQLTENPKLDDKLFTPDLTGYTVKE
jgi:outer membrane lipoprotein-sorting protein